MRKMVDPPLVVTYKRKKLRLSQEEHPQNKKIQHQIALCNGGTNLDDKIQERMVYHRKTVLEQILRLTDLKNESGVQNCIQMALSFVPSCFPSENSHKDHHKIQGETPDQTSSPDASSISAHDRKEVILGGFQNSTEDQADAASITAKCLNVLYDVLTSEKFALLCDLLCENLEGSKTKVVTDLSLVISKLANGVYKQSLELFDKDIQLVWKKLQRIGQEMTLLACSFLNASQTSCQEKGVDYNTASQFTDQITELSSKPNKSDSSYLDKISTCKECSTEARGRSSLICDNCEAMFHITCIKPAIRSFPTGSWYCFACVYKLKLSELISSTDHLDCQHQSCVVCSRLKTLGCLQQSENPEAVSASVSSRECSVPSMESEELSEPSRSGVLPLCKQCGCCEEEGKKFIICSNNACFYKYYHVNCLNSLQLASEHQPPNCWYCPSCLCRTCLSDRDDELICMCDGCDEGHHAYCMKPSRVTIPEGKWYCIKCKLEKARKGMRMYEQSILQKHGQSDRKITRGVDRSMEMLVSAAEKLRTEEEAAKTASKAR